MRRVHPPNDVNESDANADEDDSINSSNVTVKNKSNKKKTRSRKNNGLTIDIPKSENDDGATTLASEANIEDDSFDVHEYVNLVDCQRYRDEMTGTNIL